MIIIVSLSLSSVAAASGLFTIGPLGPCPPLQKNATKMRHFQAKISKKIFSGGA